MNEEELIKLIRKTIKIELQNFMLMDRYTFQKKVQIFDGFDIQLGTKTGTKIATAIDQKVGFYGTTPVDQPVTVTDPTTEGGAVQDATCRERVGDIISRLKELGLIA